MRQLYDEEDCMLGVGERRWLSSRDMGDSNVDGAGNRLAQNLKPE